MELDDKKLMTWAKRQHDIAAANGWHGAMASNAHMLALIVTEVAEIIEADRKECRYDASVFEKYKAQMGDDYGFVCFYDAEVKHTIDEEFADVCLRLLDLAWDCHHEEMRWFDDNISIPTYCRTTTEKAWHLIDKELGWGVFQIARCIAFMYLWAEQEHIDLDFHIENKLRYNAIMSKEKKIKRY